MNPEVGRWGYAEPIDGDNFCGSFETMEEAIAEGLSEHPNGIIVGQYFEYPPFREGVDTENILDSCVERLCSEWPYEDIDFLSFTPEQVAELDSALKEVIDQWARKHGIKARSLAVKNIQSFPQ